ARALDRQNQREEALENYAQAIEVALQQGERGRAVLSYRAALEQHPDFALPAGRLFSLASQMAKGEDWTGAAENFLKIFSTAPHAPEGEISLLRAAQIYGRHLHRPDLV